jgi:hypothetical protein
MQATRENVEEIGRRGEERYRREIREKVLPDHRGEFLVLDLNSGDYEVGPDDLDIEHRLRERRPEGVFYLVRVGFKTAFTMSGRMEEDE